MDFDLILTALDARTKDAFQGWAETFLADVAGQLAERDQTIKALQEESKALSERHRMLVKEFDHLSERFQDTQKQVRDEVDAALARLPVPTYKGVYDKDAEYQAGDMVTQDGSVWHCNAPVAGEKPGGNEFWTLAVKRGRDGKDAE